VFVNYVGGIAEQEQHHPNITFTWGKVEITIYTDAIDGLSENDFILAAKIDQITPSIIS
jgi:4a-hydroxytetrahydrobiopterin dehydratase